MIKSKNTQTNRRTTRLISVTEIVEIEENLTGKAYYITDIARMYSKNANGDEIYILLLMVQLPRRLKVRSSTTLLT